MHSYWIFMIIFLRGISTGELFTFSWSPGVLPVKDSFSNNSLSKAVAVILFVGSSVGLLVLGFEKNVTVDGVYYPVWERQSFPWKRLLMESAFCVFIYLFSFPCQKFCIHVVSIKCGRKEEVRNVGESVWKQLVVNEVDTIWLLLLSSLTHSGYPSGI